MAKCVNEPMKLPSVEPYTSALHIKSSPFGRTTEATMSHSVTAIPSILCAVFLAVSSLTRAGSWDMVHNCGTRHRLIGRVHRLPLQICCQTPRSQIFINTAVRHLQSGMQNANRLDTEH